MSAIIQPGKNIQKNRVDAIETILTFLFMCESANDDIDAHEWKYECPEGFQAMKKFFDFPLSHFDGAEASWLYESLRGMQNHEKLYYIPTDPKEQEELRQLPIKWDACQATYYDAIPDVYDDVKATYLMSLRRVREVPLKMVRGLFRLRSSKVVEQAIAHLFNNGTYRTTRQFLQYFGGAWHIVAAPFEFEKPEPLDEEESISLLGFKSMSFTNEYEWYVNVGYNRAVMPTIAIGTDPLGAKEVFKLRDIPPGRSRREALRNWVSGHWRQARREENPETYIWPHLRGAEEFTWNGLYCKIQPSPYDLRKAAEYQKLKGVSSARTKV